MEIDGMKCTRRYVGEAGEYDGTMVTVSARMSDGQSVEYEGRAALIVVVGDEGGYSTIAGAVSAYDLADMECRASKAALHAAFEAGCATEFAAAVIALSGILEEDGHEGD